MNLNTLVDTSFKAFLEQSSGVKLILLHPQSRYRSVVIARLISGGEQPALYYALGPDDIDLRSFLNGMTHDLTHQHPTFGRHVNILPPNAFEKLDVLLDAFARDLGEVSDTPFYLVLDEYDRSDGADDIQMFVHYLVEKLPPQCRLVINSRTLPRLPWVSLIARKLAVLLEDDQLIRRDFYDIQDVGKFNLEVFALGPGHVVMDSKAINNWEGHLPRLLFFFALDRPIVTRSEICQAFWPDLEMEQAVNVFHVTKRRLHKAMDMDVLVHDGGYYRVNPEMAIRYDVMDFAAALMEGRSVSDADKPAYWQKAIDLYRGPFLQGHEDGWIVERRANFRTGYLEALSEMARFKLAAERPEHALSLFQKALAEDDSREDIHREVIQLFVQMGRRSEAAAHYQRLADDLKKAGREPQPETAQLYSRIIR